MSKEPKPFKVEYSEESLSLLKQKLNLTRLPDELEDTPTKDDGWNYGTPLKEVKHLLEYWKDSYNWRAEEEKINQLPMFTLDIDVADFGVMTIHFVHSKSKNPNAIPLIFSHGWPGNFLEVKKLLKPLNEPSSPNDPSFHVIAPSLPGYGFSSIPKKQGLNCKIIADIFNKLMITLGYDKYVAQGGDWGSRVTVLLGQYYPRNCVATHVNFVFAPPPLRPFTAPLQFLRFLTGFYWYTKEEKESLKKIWRSLLPESGYMHEHSTKPQTVSYGLTDSPIGLLAWIREKLKTWTDNYPWTEDEIITWVMLHWIPGPAGGIRLYKEDIGSRDLLEPNNTTPLGVSIFPKELATIPRDWAEAIYNVQYWKVHDKGGHFAAWEVPELLTEDLREYFSGPAKNLTTKSGF